MQYYDAACQVALPSGCSATTAHLDDHASTQLELERLSSVAAAVELVAVCQCACVMDVNLVTIFCLHFACGGLVLQYAGSRQVRPAGSYRRGNRSNPVGDANAAGG